MVMYMKRTCHCGSGQRRVGAGTLTYKALPFQKKDVRMLRFIQEVNTTTRSCALWDLEEDTEYIVHVQAISIQGQSPASEPLLFKTPREAEKMASKNKGKPGHARVPGWGQLGEGGWAEQRGCKAPQKMEVCLGPPGGDWCVNVLLWIESKCCHPKQPSRCSQNSSCWVSWHRQRHFF